ncbi:hypothetical protein IKQ21_06330 [bacterium]|nr:hypothetical protein [bacterium]
MRLSREKKKVCVIMIQPVDALTPKVLFKGEFQDLRNPVNLRVEKNIALINSAGISTAIGAAMMAISRSYTSSWKHAGLIGLGAAALSMLFIAPRFLYKAGINSYTKQQEMDVFVREKEVQKKLLNDVNDALDNKKKGLSSKIENYSKTLIKKSA